MASEELIEELVFEQTGPELFIFHCVAILLRSVTFESYKS